MKALPIFFLLLLSGCSTVPVVTDLKPIRSLPVESMVECSKATPLTDLSFGSYIEKAGELAILLKECSLKQKELSDYIKQSN